MKENSVTVSMSLCCVCVHLRVSLRLFLFLFFLRDRGGSCRGCGFILIHRILHCFIGLCSNSRQDSFYGCKVHDRCRSLNLGYCLLLCSHFFIKFIGVFCWDRHWVFDQQL